MSTEERFRANRQDAGDYCDLKASLKNHEGCVSYLYRDSRGNVTVGIGHLLSNCGQAEKLTFIIRATGGPAVAADIIKDFNAVAACPSPQVYTHYKPFTRLDMPEAAIEALLDADLADKEAGVRRGFAGYDGYPSAAKQALLDMAFNLGISGLVDGYPHLKAAAESHDWDTCCRHCHRNGIPDDRNEWTRQQFLKAKQAQAVLD